VATSTNICDGAIRARPYYAAVGADISGLDAMGKLRPIGGAAQIWHRKATQRAGPRHGSGGKKLSAGKSADNFARYFKNHAGLFDRRDRLRSI
jgi:hypothetical protein